MTTSVKDWVEDRSFEEIAKDIWNSVNQSVTQVNKTLQFLETWENQLLNSIVQEYFNEERDKFWNDIKKFTQFLVEWLKEYLSFVSYLNNHRLSWPEDERRDKQNTDFEWKYHKVLYYWQQDPIEPMKERKKVAQIEKKAPFMKKVRWAIDSILGNR